MLTSELVQLMEALEDGIICNGFQLVLDVSSFGDSLTLRGLLVLALLEIQDAIVPDLLQLLNLLMELDVLLEGDLEDRSLRHYLFDLHVKVVGDTLGKLGSSLHSVLVGVCEVDVLAGSCQGLEDLLDGLAYLVQI